MNIVVIVIIVILICNSSEDEWRSPSNLTPDGVFYDTTTEGLLRTKYNVSEYHPRGREMVLVDYLHDGAKEPYALWNMTYVPEQHVALHHVSQLPQKDVAYYASNIVPIHPVNPVVLFDFTKQVKPHSEDFREQSFVQPGPQIYIVKSGNTLESIAEQLYDDVFFARDIAKVNGLFGKDSRLLAGNILTLPQVMPCRNKAGMSLAYHRFVSVLSGSLSPHLVILPKKEHHASFFSALVKVIALAIVLYAAPYLAGVGLNALGITTVGGALNGMSSLGIASLSQLSTTQMAGAMLATGVAAGIGDAAVQGLAIGFDMQSHFSFNEMLETGVTAGVGLSVAGHALTIKGVAGALMKVGIANATTQLIEMQLGTRDKFDAKAALMQVSATALSMGISRAMNPPKSTQDYVAQQVFRRAANTALGVGITNTPPDIQQLATEMTGDMVNAGLNQLSYEPVPSLQEELDNKIIADFLKSSPEMNFLKSSPHVTTWHDALPNPRVPTELVAQQLSEMNLARMASRANWIAFLENEINPDRMASETSQIGFFGHMKRVGEAGWRGVKNLPSDVYNAFTATDTIDTGLVGTIMFLAEYAQADFWTRAEIVAESAAPVGVTALLTRSVSGVGMFGRGMERGSVVNIGAKTVNPRVGKMTKIIEDFLGEDFKFIKNKKGDPIFINQDNTKRIRFDSTYSHGDTPHGHVEIFKNNDWFAYTNQHRIYLSSELEPNLLPKKKI